MSARLCEHLREISDDAAELVGFQFKERVDQARALGRKRHFDEDGRLDLLGFLCAGWEFIKKKAGRRPLALPRSAPSWQR
jgi:hypothetical protein